MPWERKAEKEISWFCTRLPLMSGVTSRAVPWAVAVTTTMATPLSVKLSFTTSRARYSPIRSAVKEGVAEVAS
ncbi:hypothetical protein [Desulfonema magnum]|uniref:hypothetical protein n=1 Tax=Desulfonema magnum TaxID=45655 RepID=UPI001A9B052E|nr:hypothetical protein [Desulfonema magnum]